MTERWRITLPAALVAVGAVAATAHGLYEVAVAAGVPWWIAPLYPGIADGLALTAYAATTRLRGPGAAYAWVVVVLAAGLSGLAQAAYLAGATTGDVAWQLRAGVGAWPAVAAVVVAHLRWLLTSFDETDGVSDSQNSAQTPGQLPLTEGSVAPQSPPPGPPASSPWTAGRAAVPPDPESLDDLPTPSPGISRDPGDDLPTSGDASPAREIPRETREETWEQLAWRLLEEDASGPRLRTELGISEYYARQAREASGRSREEAWEVLSRARNGNGRPRE